MRIRTRILGEHPLLQNIEITGYQITATWIKGGDGLIAFGNYRSTSVSGKDRFNSARKWWQNELNQLSIDNDQSGFGTGPILFTSFSFNRDEPSLILIPEIVVVVKNGKSWITWVGDGDQPEIREAKSSARNSNEITWNEGTLTEAVWKERVSKAITEIKSNSVDKVVMARDAIATAKNKIEVRSMLNNLISEYPSTHVFYLENLIGATPELLVRLSKGLVTSRVLAGTIRKTGNEEKDFANAASLAKSSKDLEEHEYAVRSVVEAISTYTQSTNVPDSPFVLHLANVMHLATDVTGVIHDSNNAIDIFTLLNSLHPTAAVCGTPRSKAYEVISQLEGMSRARYSGPIGWIDYRGDGEIGIALRCGEIAADGMSLRAFAGCGIVIGSDPEKELAEAYAKLAPMRNALLNSAHQTDI